MEIDDLYSVLPRPSNPVGTGDDKLWLRVSEKVGTRLPIDYVYFINSYGTGTVNDFLVVLNPFASQTYLNLLEQMPRLLSMLRELREEYPEEYPYPLYFEPGGLLPWGMSDSGDTYCWLTEGSPDLWPVVTVPRHSDMELFEVTMVKFIEAALRGQLESSAIPTEFSQRTSFVPASEA